MIFLNDLDRLGIPTLPSTLQLECPPRGAGCLLQNLRPARIGKERLAPVALRDRFDCQQVYSDLSSVIARAVAHAGNRRPAAPYQLNRTSAR